jgi:hypothetical protein
MARNPKFIGFLLNDIINFNAFNSQIHIKKYNNYSPEKNLKIK